MSSDLQHQAAYESSIRGFLNRQLREQPGQVPRGQTCAGQVVIVTGSNSGIGLEASRQLLDLGVSRLILAVRSTSKGREVAVKLQGGLAKSFPTPVIEVWELDMASYPSIIAFVSRCEAELPRIDIVLLNAGFRSTKFSRHPETGHEMSLQVNFFGTSLLSALLVPILRAKKRSSQQEVSRGSASLHPIRYIWPSLISQNLQSSSWMRKRNIVLPDGTPRLSYLFSCS